MKRIKFWLFVAFVSSPIFIFSNFRPDAGAQLETAVYPGKSAESVKLAIRKPEDRRVLVDLYDERGDKVAEHVVGRRTRAQMVHFDLRELPAGTYRLQVTDGQTTRVKELTLRTPPAPQRQLAVRVVQ